MKRFLRAAGGVGAFPFVFLLGSQRVLLLLLVMVYYAILVPLAMTCKLLGRSAGWMRGCQREGWRPIRVSSHDRSTYEERW
jgi:hypothetical protein